MIVLSTPQSRFSKVCVFTSNVIAKINPIEVALAMKQHQASDWWKTKEGQSTRHLTEHLTLDGKCFCIITEVDQSVTNIFVPEDTYGSTD